MTAINHIDLTVVQSVPKRVHARIARETLRKIATRHVQVTLGKHFKNVPETQPGGAYGYVERDPKYTEMKRRRFGHNLPNVLTGRMRNGIRNNSIVRATQIKATIQIKAPARTTGRADRNFSMTEQQRKEITAISPAEQREMQDLAIEHYSREAAKPANQLKRRKRV